MYLSYYYPGEGEVSAAPLVFPTLTYIFIFYCMGAGDPNLGVGLRLKDLLTVMWEGIAVAES